MPRPIRIEYKDAYYHVMNRGKARQKIFDNDKDFKIFLKTIEEAAEHFAIKVHAYCLMDNHYHLLIQTPLANLSRAVRHINGVYTQRYNRIRKTDGPLFRGRYKAILVQADEYLLQLSRYIHLNPIQTKKPLVKKLVDYRWSSYPAYIGKAKASAWLDMDFSYKLLNKSNKLKAYEAFVENGIDEEIAEFYEKKNLAPILGNERFVEDVKNNNADQAKKVALNAALDLFPSLERIIEVVACEFNVTENSITHNKRGKAVENQSRKVAIYISKKIGKQLSKDIAKKFNFNCITNVNVAIKRLEKAMKENKELEGMVDNIINNLDEEKVLM